MEGGWSKGQGDGGCRAVSVAMMDNTTTSKTMDVPGDEDPRDDKTKMEVLSHESYPCNNSQDNTECNSNTTNLESSKSSNALEDDIKNLTTHFLNIQGNAPLNLASSEERNEVAKMEQQAEGVQDRGMVKSSRQEDLQNQCIEVKLPGKFVTGDFEEDVNLEEEYSRKSHLQELEQASPAKRQKVVENVQEIEGEKNEHFSEQLFRRLKQRQKEETNIPLAGVFEKLELHNFLCHSNLVLDFNRHINFIVGKTGSGKSAIMTAIIIALGDESEDTSQGRNLAEFIQKGADEAQIRLTISNHGINAYMQEKYGETIILNRLINKSGSKLMIETFTEEINEAAIRIHEVIRIHQQVKESLVKMNEENDISEKDVRIIRICMERMELQKIKGLSIRKVVQKSNEVITAVKQLQVAKAEHEALKHQLSLQGEGAHLNAGTKQIEEHKLSLVNLFKKKEAIHTKITTLKKQLDDIPKATMIAHLQMIDDSSEEKKVESLNLDVNDVEQQLKATLDELTFLEAEESTLKKQIEQLDLSESDFVKLNQKYIESHVCMIEKEMNVTKLTEELAIAKQEIPPKMTKMLSVMMKLRKAREKGRQLKATEIEIDMEITWKKNCQKNVLESKKILETNLCRIMPLIQEINASFESHTKVTNQTCAKIDTTRSPYLNFNEIEKCEAYLKTFREKVDPKLVKLVYQQIEECEKSQMYAQIADFYQSYFVDQPYQGEIEFDHTQQAMKIFLKQKHPPNEVLNNPTDEERSFSLIALILAVTNQMLSPFYIMDEFDKFMAC
ncbi:hypothetical protein B566_EDAN001196 [Ephemera danica]|nr:hypothetical protein B566_EDAN001196 [Ephemera danica]